jgi:hypothetical protein
MASVTKPNLLQSTLHSIDSLKIRIPLAQVEVLNESIMHHWVRLNTGTGEIDTTEFKNKAYYHKGNGYSTKYLVQEQSLPNQSPITYLTIGVSAKLLESRYQEGITPETLPTLYSQLIDQGEVKFSYESFGKGIPSDIDVKRDFGATCEVFSGVMHHMESFTIPHKSTDKGVKSWNQKTNQGIEWNKRETNAYMKAPYLKMYNKSLELKHKSTDFASYHLSGYDIDNVIRIEATLKNKKHMAQFGINGNTLMELVNTPQDKYHSFISHAIKTNLEGYQMKPNLNQEGFTTRQKILLSLIGYALQRDMGITEVYGMATPLLEGSTKRKVRAEINNLYEQTLKAGTVKGLTENDIRERVSKAHEVNRILTEILDI